LIAQSFNNSLSDAFFAGGCLWLVISGLTIGFAINAKHEKYKQLGALM